jgi:hypothetical protein
MAYIRPLPLAILTAIATSTCSSDRTLTWAAPTVPPSGLFSFVGTVHLAPVEVGCWVLQTATDTYEPINLPSQFRIDGQVVRAVAHSVAGASTCMVGKLIAVDTLQSR